VRKHCISFLGVPCSFVRPADRQRALLSRLLQASAVAQALELPWHKACAAILRTPLGRPCLVSDGEGPFYPLDFS